MSEETGYKWTKTDFAALIAAVIMMIIGFLISNFMVQSQPEEPPGWPFPTWGPPAFVFYLPTIFLSIPLIICIILMSTANRRHRAKAATAGVHRYRDDTIVYTGDYQLDQKPESKEPEKVYLIPTECPSCFKPISADVVDWVGPLKAKCPYCETIVDAKEKTF